MEREEAKHRVRLTMPFGFEIVQKTLTSGFQARAPIVTTETEYHDSSADHDSMKRPSEW
jgi:hypothetical protein